MSVCLDAIFPLILLVLLQLFPTILSSDLLPRFFYRLF
jgi:hypothetical protein